MQLLFCYFRTFFVYSPMNWQDFISQYPTKLVIEWTGAPKRTVYGWRDGSSSPYEWQQPIFREWILRKAEHATREAKGEREVARDEMEK